MKAACEGADIVFNFAGIADLGDANNSPFETAKMNILGNICVLDSYVECRVSRYIFASSMYVDNVRYLWRSLHGHSL